MKYYEHHEVCTSMLPVFKDEQEWRAFVNLSNEKPNHYAQIEAFGYVQDIKKYVPLYEVAK